MVQVNQRFCPRCGKTIVPQQQFCLRCGLNLTALHSPANHAPLASIAPPDVVERPPITEEKKVPLPSFTPSTPFPTGSVPGHKSPMNRSVVVASLLILLLLFGAVAYAGAPAFRFQLERTIPPAITTTKLGTTVTYAGVAVTVVDVQQAAHFVDDTATNATQVVRVHLNAQNHTTVAVNLMYPAIVRLVLPGARTVAPDYVKARIGLPAGASQMAVIDFPLTAAMSAKQLTLRLGAANEAQMDIPLGEHVDLSQYAARTKTVAQQLKYFGLNWAIDSVSSQLSIAGQQAQRGMRYIVISLRVDNTLSQVAIPGSPYTYMRLKVADTTLSPVYTTLPVSFATRETGQTGTVTFLVPQQASSATFILADQQPNGFDQAVTSFPLP
jgi:hypothetical protein